MPEPAIVVHGGAGRLAAPAEHARLREGAARAADAGFAVLARGGDALDAVEAAVLVLEDDPSYNAGRGAALTDAGGVELDAAVMRGRDRAAGAVAHLREIRHPVSAARSVLEAGRHVLLVGEPAGAFAREQGLEARPEAWFVTEAQRAALARRAASSHGTVGAVARDARGGLAAATSTGGINGQWPGRVGDSPLIAAGTWADDETAAVSCTGTGEAIIRAALAHEVDALVRHGGVALADAAVRALARLARYGGDGGLIAVGPRAIAVVHTAPAMTHAARVGAGPVQAAVAVAPGAV